MNKTIESDQIQIVNQFLVQELISDSPILLASQSEPNRLEDHQQLMASLNSEIDEEPPF